MNWVLGPVEDWRDLALAPLWALALGLLVGVTPLGTARFTLLGETGSPAYGFLGCFTFAHLSLVFFRSHGDPAIRALHPFRFWVVPPVLFALFALSPLARGAGLALAVWWDAYHSSLQTFGIGRIFDAKAGNGAEPGRAMDLALNLFLYIGPILGGALLMYHAAALYGIPSAGRLAFDALPPRILALQGRLRLLLLALGIPFLTAYAAYYAFLVSQGYRVDARKVVLLLSTGVCSVWAWGFNPLGMGLFIMNFFHAWQYFALVWRYERATVARVLRLRDGWPAFAGMAAVAFAYGALGHVLADLSTLALSATVVVSLLHFWYDGFVWSVRRGQV